MATAKRLSGQARLGQLGANMIEEIVLSKLNALWTPTTSASDVGVDGYIELCHSESGDATNLIIQVQSKATDRPWEQETDKGFIYRARSRDLRHWLGGNTPIILIVCRPHTKEAYWVPLKEYFSQPEQRKTCTIRFNKLENRFDQTAQQALQQIAIPRESGLYLGPACLEETLDSNLIPIARFPQVIYSAVTDKREASEVRSAIKNAGLKNANAWFLKDGNIYSFYDLKEEPWRSVCDHTTIEKHTSSDWAESNDLVTQNDFIRLIGNALQSMLGSRGVWLFRPKNGPSYYYFAPSKDLSEKVVSWKDRKASSRSVFKGYPNKKDPSRMAYYRHLAFERRFQRFGFQWYMEITPTYHFTTDGKTIHPFADSLTSAIKRLEKHAAVHAHVNFLSHFLCAEPDLFLLNRQSDLLNLVLPQKFNLEFGIPEAEWIKKADTDELKRLAQPDLETLNLFHEN